MRCSSRSLLATMRGRSEARRVEDLPGLDAQVGEVARSRGGCRPSSCPRSRSRRADLDRVAHALERVVGVDEEDAVVGLGPRLGLEGLELGVEGHDPAVGVRARAPGCRRAGRRARWRSPRSRRRRPRGRRERPPSMPWARRRPKSITASPRAARQTRAALVAIRVWKLTMLSSAVSTSCAWRIGPRTRTSGSWGKTTVPSGTASTSQREPQRRRARAGRRGRTAAGRRCRRGPPR